jgi:hypothetical protein
MRHGLSVTCAALAAALSLAPAALAGAFAEVQVDFAPAALAKMQHQYGEGEVATLRSAILAAVSRASRKVQTPAGLQVSITVRNVAPTHPTRKQSADNPSLDVVHTKYIGGADLVAEVRDAGRHLLTKVTYRHFPQTLALGSNSVDPWADARLAIEDFAIKLAAACQNLHRT